MIKRLANNIAVAVLLAATVVTVLILGAIILYVFVNGISMLSPRFVFTWPHGVNAEGGVWPTIVSTLYVTGLSMLVCTPVAVLAAV
ncbi:MAG: phosphate ABC transporter, permease protein PstA, partial [Coriobacteriia bacterium]|nr:phosphate ABC transporter, permease protein PstA [Coriobacteriia bacterium]